MNVQELEEDSNAARLKDPRTAAECDAWNIKQLTENIDFGQLEKRDRKSLIRALSRFIIKNKGKIDG